MPTALKLGTPTHHVGARVPADVAAEFARLAAAEGRSVSMELRRLIDLRIEAEKGVEPAATGSNAAPVAVGEPKATDES